MHRALLLIALAACGGEEDASSGQPSGTVPAPGAPSAPGAAAPPAAPPPPTTPAGCLVGHWRATDFLSMARRGARRSMRRPGPLSHTGGQIDYVFSPLDATGHGTVAITATDLTYGASFREGPVNVNIVLRMTGNETRPYDATAEELHVATPTTGSIDAAATATTRGIVNTTRTQHENLDLAGTFAYNCSEATLRFTGRRGNAETGEAIELTRVP